MKNLKDNSGISLFETLIALVLVGTTLISLMVLASKTYTIVSANKIQDTANQLADKTLECAIAYRGERNFDSTMRDLNKCKGFVGYDSNGNITIKGQGDKEIGYHVEWGGNSLGGTQLLSVKVTPTEDTLKTAGGKDLCILLETVIFEEGPGGLYVTGPSSALSCD